MSLKILEIISSSSPQLEQADRVQKSLNIWWDYPLKLLKVYFKGIYDIPLTIQWQRCTVYYNRSTSCKMTEAHYADDTVTSFTETEVHLVKWHLVQGRKYIWYSVQKHILCSETYILYSDRSIFCTVTKLLFYGDRRDIEQCRSTSWIVSEVHTATEVRPVQWHKYTLSEVGIVQEQKYTVKSANLVTLLRQNNFFLRKIFR
jgi:hypothetical protein